MENMTVLLEGALKAAREAGEKILDIYENEDFEKTVDFKADDSPLTVADKASHEVIQAHLDHLAPEIPVMSEEGRDIPYDERRDWETFWCVDPLDGTKEFIKKNGEFTVNIALIRNRKPILGVIYTPVTDTMYYGVEGEGGFKEVGGEKSTLELSGKTTGLIAVKSRSHASEEEDEMFKKHGVTDTISVGSSLKFCMVAEGKADIYYRHGPTMEWDTAAGQAIAEACGGVMTDIDGQPFLYNKEVLRNGSFLVKGNQ